jgi:YgiT-type zinc finger domain-containing protein
MKTSTNKKEAVVTDDQVAELEARILAARSGPLFPTGSVTVCPNCGGRMLTTNELERAVAAPGMLYIVTRLPGAKCEKCESSELDGLGAAILAQSAPRGIRADYETAVTHSSGSTLGTYFKMDLVRVLHLSGNERSFWTVVDSDRCLVRIERPNSAAPDGSVSGKSGSPKGKSDAGAATRRAVRASG